MINNQNKNININLNSNSNQNDKIFDLEERTTEYAKRVIRLCKKLPRNPINDRLVPQAISSSGSMGANYREANDALGDKDFLHRMRIARKEGKESIHWLELICEANLAFKSEIEDIIREGRELKNILSSIIKNKENKS